MLHTRYDIGHSYQATHRADSTFATALRAAKAPRPPICSCRTQERPAFPGYSCSNEPRNCGTRQRMSISCGSIRVRYGRWRSLSPWALLAMPGCAIQDNPVGIGEKPRELQASPDFTLTTCNEKCARGPKPPELLNLSAVFESSSFSHAGR